MPHARPRRPPDRLAAAGAASAQATDAPRPKRRYVPPATRPAEPAPPPAPAPPVRGGRLALGGLTGLRPPDDGGAACRGACARGRYSCELQSEVCVAPWTTCLKSCSDQRTPGPTTLLPR